MNRYQTRYADKRAPSADSGKKQRPTQDEPPSPQKRKKIPQDTTPAHAPKVDPALLEKYHGQGFSELLTEIARSSVSQQFPPGTQVWVKIPGFCAWPGVTWSLELTRLVERPDVILNHRPGHVLCLFMGEHSLSWVPEHELTPLKTNYDSRLKTMEAWGKRNNSAPLVAATVSELSLSSNECREEVDRIWKWVEQVSSIKHMRVPVCEVCEQEGALLDCGACRKACHALCLKPPALSKAFIAADAPWTCPCCSHVNIGCPAAADSAASGAAGAAGAAADGEDDDPKDVERMGLTPDFIIHTAAFKVFNLQRPTPRAPYIPGLLDPCTNNKAKPNIPAEKLYDKKDNGLKLSNSWAGYHILLNPDYRSHILWRFVNRAVDEVENDSVPAVILVGRNSTDTAYFQRLTPYPRIHLRRNITRFKDYDSTPIGFGVSLICIAKMDKVDLFQRFIHGFSAYGEPNIPIDAAFMATTAFLELVARLRTHADEMHRDHWVQCNTCGKWRILPFDQMASVKGKDEWNCSMLPPPNTGCETPQSRREVMGVHYTASIAEEKDPQLGLTIWLGQQQGQQQGQALQQPAALLPAPAQEQQPSHRGPDPEQGQEEQEQHQEADPRTPRAAPPPRASPPSPPCGAEGDPTFTADGLRQQALMAAPPAPALQQQRGAAAADAQAAGAPVGAFVPPCCYQPLQQTPGAEGPALALAVAAVGPAPAAAPVAESAAAVVAAPAAAALHSPPPPSTLPTPERASSYMHDGRAGPRAHDKVGVTAPGSPFNATSPSHICAWFQDDQPDASMLLSDQQLLMPVSLPLSLADIPMLDAAPQSCSAGADSQLPGVDSQLLSDGSQQGRRPGIGCDPLQQQRQLEAPGAWLQPETAACWQQPQPMLQQQQQQQQQQQHWMATSNPGLNPDCFLVTTEQERNQAQAAAVAQAEQKAHEAERRAVAATARRRELEERMRAELQALAAEEAAALARLQQATQMLAQAQAQAQG